MKTYIALILTVAGFSSMLFSQTQRDMGIHVHGSTTLNVAVDEAVLFIELDTSWNNFVGFAHAPHDV